MAGGNVLRTAARGGHGGRPAAAPSASDPEIVARADGLGYAYRPGEFAVRHLDLELRRGEIFGLLGRNGAGKTTTVRLLTTLLPPTEGSGSLFGRDLRECGRAERARMGVVLQSESLDFVSVERNLMLYAFLWGVSRESAKSRTEEMLELFELTPSRQRKPWALSGGERRRFQVARELMHDMELLFLDEPTVGLDALTRRRILTYLAGRARAGLSIVFTTHILHEADELCDRIGILQHGRLRASGAPQDLKREYRGARFVEAELDRPLTAEEGRDLDAALARRNPEYVEVARGPTRLEFRAPEAEGLVAELAAWASARGTRLLRIAVREPTLEEAFVGLVQEGAPELEGEEVEGS